MSRFRKGIRLPFRKAPAITQPTAELTDIPQIWLPYAYPTQATVIPTVSLYDTVSRGTPLSTVQDDPCAAVFSSVTGVISGEKTVDHPLYGELHCAMIDCMQTQPPISQAPIPDEPVTPDEIIFAAQSAGIIDEGDGIPLSLKLAAWRENGCGFLVCDAVQVQPYASSAWAILRANAEEVLGGLHLAAACVGASGYHIAACLSHARRRSLYLRIGKDHLFQVDSRYPVDAFVCYGSQPGDHTAVYGSSVRCIGVQACLALYRAVRFRESYSYGVVTVAGDAIRNPQNVRVPFGTPVQEVLRYCKVDENPAYLILGDTMTGTAALSQDIPILPGMTCLLAFSAQALPRIPSGTCIGCGRCAQVCHVDILPFEIRRRYENMHYERLASLSPQDCDGCGACSYVCPVGLDLAVTVQEAAVNADGSLFFDVEEDTDA